MKNKKLIIEYLIQPYFLAGIFAFYICWLTKSEILTYIYSFVFIFLIFIGKMRKKKKYLWILLLLCPSFIKISFIFLILIFRFIFGGHKRIFNKIATEHDEKGESGEVIYVRYISFFMIFFILLTVFLFATPRFIFLYFKDNNPYVYILFVGTVIAMIFVFIFYFLITAIFDLIRFAFKKQDENDNYKVIFSYFIIMLVFFTLPDIVYSLLYSFIISVILNEDYTFGSMYYYSFMLHFLIPMNSYYLGIQNIIQHNFMLGFINGMHSYTVKIIDSVLVSAIIVSLLANRLQSIFENKK